MRYGALFQLDYSKLRYCYDQYKVTNCFFLKIPFNRISSKSLFIFIVEILVFY